MKLFTKVLAVMGLLLLSSCAPQLMALESFPIKPGVRWNLSLAANPAVNHSFVLRGQPERTADYISYEGVAGNKEMDATLFDNGLLLVVIYNEDNKPFDKRNAVYCFMFQEGPLWGGNGLVGTFADDIKSKPSGFLRNQPRCEARPS